MREARFASIEQKRGAKNSASLSIACVDPQALAGKSLAALALPLLTGQGLSRMDIERTGQWLDEQGIKYRTEVLARKKKDSQKRQYLGALRKRVRCAQPKGSVPYPS